MRSRVLPTLVAAAFAVVLPTSSGRAASLLPLESEDALLLPTGRVELTIGAHYLRNARPAFAPGVEREQWSAPEVGVSGGLGPRVEAQFRWEALSISDRIPGQDNTVDAFGSGDARFFTKIRFFSEGAYDLRWFPAVSFHFGVKLPDASKTNGLGTDEADFFARFLLSETLGDVRLLGNAGMGVIGNPGPTRGQDDVLLWSVAAIGPWMAAAPNLGAQLIGEVTGVEGSRYGNEPHHLGLGLRAGGDRFAGTFGGTIGLDSKSEDFGLRFGIIWSFEAFSE